MILYIFQTFSCGEIHYSLNEEKQKYSLKIDNLKVCIHLNYFLQKLIMKLFLFIILTYSTMQFIIMLLDIEMIYLWLYSSSLNVIYGCKCKLLNFSYWLPSTHTLLILEYLPVCSHISSKHFHWKEQKTLFGNTCSHTEILETVGIVVHMRIVFGMGQVWIPYQFRNFCIWLLS